jgi:hypothetical protein
MDANIKAKWLEALRSGKYRKARGQLRRIGRQMCCLGVLCDILPEVKWESVVARYRNSFSRVQLPKGVNDLAGLPVNREMDLSNLNDSKAGWEPVIQYIETEL